MLLTRLILNEVYVHTDFTDDGRGNGFASGDDQIETTWLNVLCEMKTHLSAQLTEDEINQPVSLEHGIAQMCFILSQNLEFLKWIK